MNIPNFDWLGVSPATMAGLANAAGQTDFELPDDNLDQPFEGEVLGDVDAPGFAPAPAAPPYQPNPGLPGYNPNPGATKEVAPQPPPTHGAVLGWQPPPPPPREPTEFKRDAAPEPAQPAGYAVPPAQSVTVPAHWQPGTHTVAMAHGMDPEELQPGQEERELGFRQAYAGSLGHLQAAQEKGMADAVEASARAMMAQRTAEKMAAIEQRRQAYVDDQQRKLADLATQAQQKVDPNELFKERGTLGSVLTGVMIGLGQFASMWTGRGSNAALDITNEQINRNIAAQRTNIDNAHHAFDTASALYKQNLAAFGDEERATLATKMQYLDGVIALADAQRVKAGLTDQEAQQNDFLKGLYLERAKAADDFAKATHTQVTEQENETFRPAQVLGGGGGGIRRDGNIVLTSDGKAFHFENKELAQEGQKRLAAASNVQRLSTEIVKLRKETKELNTIAPTADGRKKYEANIQELKRLNDELLQAKSTANGQGVVTKADVERDEAMGLNATAGLGTLNYFTDPIDTDYEAANKSLDLQAQDYAHRGQDFVHAIGGSEVNLGYQRDASGNLVPSYSHTGRDAAPYQYVPPAGSKSLDDRKGPVPQMIDPDAQMKRRPVSTQPTPTQTAAPGKKTKGPSVHAPKRRR